MGVKLFGALEMRVKMKDLSKRAQQSVVDGVEEFERVEMKEMQRRVPKDTGELHDSGYIDKPEIQGNNIVGGMGFTAEHAIFVHEDLEAIHPNGEAKFMESVLNESEPHFGERVGEHVKKDLGL